MTVETIGPNVREKGTAVFTIAFTDETDAAVTPSAITWTLTDLDGNIVNSRNAVAVGTPANSIVIVLSGNDLIIGAHGTKRQLLVQATYDSDAGSDLPNNQAINFVITDLVAVT